MTTKRNAPGSANPEGAQLFESCMNYSKNDPWVLIGMTNPPAFLPPKLTGRDIFSDIRVHSTENQPNPEWRAMIEQLNADGFTVLSWPDNVRAAIQDIKPHAPGWFLKMVYENARRFLEHQSALTRIPSEFRNKEAHA